jgi:peroxiredoxin Q/BCP
VANSRASWPHLAALACLGGCAALQQRSEPPAPPPVTAAPTLEEGAAVPQVAVVGPGDKPVRLSDYRGKALVVFFYPVDFGSSAIAEVEEFKAEQPKFKKAGVTLLGVSADHITSHADFTARYKLPFTLLSDQGGSLATALGVPLEAGTTRHYTFYIDRHGVVRKVWKNVRAWGHAAAVLEAVKSAKDR